MVAEIHNLETAAAAISVDRDVLVAFCRARNIVRSDPEALATLAVAKVDAVVTLQTATIRALRARFDIDEVNVSAIAAEDRKVSGCTFDDFVPVIVVVTLFIVGLALIGGAGYGLYRAVYSAYGYASAYISRPAAPAPQPPSRQRFGLRFDNICLNGQTYPLVDENKNPVWLACNATYQVRDAMGEIRFKSTDYPELAPCADDFVRGKTTSGFPILFCRKR